MTRHKGLIVRALRLAACGSDASLYHASRLSADIRAVGGLTQILRDLDADAARDESDDDWRELLATRCPECGHLQFRCRGGISCENGHGY